jgi:predicted HTH transcriptional regulator
MLFLELISLMANQKTVDLLKIIEFLNLQVEIQNRMIHESRKILTKQEKYSLANLAYGIRHILRLGKIKTVFKPETILKWYTQYANSKFDGSKNRKPKVGRPETDAETVKLIIQMAQEKTKPGWRSLAGLTSPFN